ncbi:integrase core domain-containing protein [Streptomyces sp. BE133]|uniref:integrase core domain-containing protein n=1 Tax=Streptomyces sp. BE133 TaxID=3002523 RepID=UPI002E79FB7C|nr:integrase core domain-containing protein [Streptomyces sp. BE133]MEE1809061.1 integrase core domain-containing protein [Streptomyces sp. BE133]
MGKGPAQQAPRRRPTSTLWQNLGSAVEKTVASHRSCLRDLPPPHLEPEPAWETPAEAAPSPDTELDEPTGKFAERARAHHSLVHDLLAQGMRSQCTSFRLAEHLEKAEVAASIGSVGDAYDNALMESTIGLFKTELIKPGRPWKTLSQAELATAEWIDWYCHRRLHGEIGHLPPVEYETNYYLATTKPQVTTTI